MKKTPSIIFMGTPEFATASLKVLYENNYDIKAVVTATDKPAGRGQNLRISDVKKYALEKNLNILQPNNLKDEKFINELKSLDADLFVVVAFRMLPKSVWEIPKMGCFNLHASLLPNYRGATPINHAIISGETKTGVTSFFINENIDTGDIILQETVEIKEDLSAGDLHDILMKKGAGLVLKTVEIIESGNYRTISQNNIPEKNIKPAPKITKEFCKINWNNNCDDLHNFIRGLSPYPTAYTKIINKNNEEKLLKIFKTDYLNEKHNLNPGTISSDNKTYIKIACKDGYIVINELQIEGKKHMNISDFLRGNNINDYKSID